MKLIDIILLIFTVLTSVLCLVLVDILMKPLLGSLPGIFNIGLYFAIVGFVVTLMTHICVYKLSPIKNNIPLKGAFLKSLGIFLPIATVVLFVLGCLFQYIYGLDIISNAYVENYIVAIDNSGSMLDNDPDFKRYDALKELFTYMEKDQTIQVYVFNDRPELVFPTKTIGQNDVDDFDETFEPYKISDGGTDVMFLLNTIADEASAYKKGTASVIVISDGECDIDRRTLARFPSIGIPVNTVGINLVDPVNALNEIANATGGTYYHVDNIEGLVGAFKGITERPTERLLTELRNDATRTSKAHALMRVLFLFLLGFAVKLIQMFTIDIDTVRKTVLIQGFGFSFIGAALTEILLQNFGIGLIPTHLQLLLFISLLLLPVIAERFSLSDSYSHEFSVYTPESMRKDNHKVFKSTIHDSKKLHM